MIVVSRNRSKLPLTIKGNNCNQWSLLFKVKRNMKGAMRSIHEQESEVFSGDTHSWTHGKISAKREQRNGTRKGMLMSCFCWLCESCHLRKINYLEKPKSLSSLRTRLNEIEFLPGVGGNGEWIRCKILIPQG